MSAVLLVLCDALADELWAPALAACGHDVLEVRRIADGVVRAREGGIDVIVLDAPIGDDDDGAGAIRTLVGELERLPDAPPLVLVSGSPKAPELSARVGAAGFLPKPCPHEDLVELVARVTSAAVRVRPFDDETTSPRRF